MEKDESNHDIEKIYYLDSECKVNTRKRRGNLMSRNRQNDQNDQNVRDPVREKAQQNYAAVIAELNNKFRGLKAGCFPRPKGLFYKSNLHKILGCMCVVGKEANGEDKLDRRFDDSDCKCKPNERSNECPAPAA